MLYWFCFGKCPDAKCRYSERHYGECHYVVTPLSGDTRHTQKYSFDQHEKPPESNTLAYFAPAVSDEEKRTVL
jgi:hypothetical protein